MKEIMKMIVEDATGTATDPAIILAVRLGEGTRILAGAIAERSQATRQGAIPVPSVPLSSALNMLGIPSVDIPDGPEVPASAPGDPEAPASFPETLASAQGPHAILALEVPAWIPTNQLGHRSTRTIRHCVGPKYLQSIPIPRTTTSTQPLWASPKTVMATPW